MSDTTPRFNRLLITGAAMAVGMLAEQRISDHRRAKAVARELVYETMRAFEAELNLIDRDEFLLTGRFEQARDISRGAADADLRDACACRPGRRCAAGGSDGTDGLFPAAPSGAVDLLAVLGRPRRPRPRP